MFLDNLQHYQSKINIFRQISTFLDKSQHFDNLQHFYITHISRQLTTYPHF